MLGRCKTHWECRVPAGFRTRRQAGESAWRCPQPTVLKRVLSGWKNNLLSNSAGRGAPYISPVRWKQEQTSSMLPIAAPSCRLADLSPLSRRGAKQKLLGWLHQDRTGSNREFSRDTPATLYPEAASSLPLIRKGLKVLLAPLAPLIRVSQRQYRAGDTGMGDLEGVTLRQQARGCELPLPNPTQPKNMKRQVG